MNTDICQKCETVRCCMEKGCRPILEVPHNVVKQVNGQHRIIPISIKFNEQGVPIDVKLV